jgi:hypothetical protein
MSRLGTFGVAMLTGVFGLFVTGFIASLAVDWYNIPGREGESGYFVVMLAVLGFAAGVVIGWLVARMARARGRDFFLRCIARGRGGWIGHRRIRPRARRCSAAARRRRCCRRQFAFRKKTTAPVVEDRTSRERAAFDSTLFIPFARLGDLSRSG